MDGQYIFEKKKDFLKAVSEKSKVEVYKSCSMVGQYIFEINKDFLKMVYGKSPKVCKGMRRREVNEDISVGPRGALLFGS